MTDLANALPEAEKQLLVALGVVGGGAVESGGDASDRQALEAAGDAYFGMYRVSWEAADEGLVARDLVWMDGRSLGLTPAGRDLGEALRRENPRHRYFYDEFFTRVARSPAHAAFCERVYGRDLAQHGMMDLAQLARLLEVLRLDARSRVLELGCGNGLVAEYISDLTSAHVTGIDTSAVGIAQAVRRTAGKRSRLAFVQGDMRVVDLAPSSFDAVIAVDTLYFVPDLRALLERLRAAAPGGQMGAYYSTWAASDAPMDRLLPDNTPLGQALRASRLAYSVLDFSEEEKVHWTKKLRVARELRQAFEAEGNEFLYQRRSAEAESHQKYVESGRLGRYLYHIRL